MEYRQAELRLEQLYTQIRMQVVNAQFALTNDRAQVQASIAARDYNQQSLDAEEKKLRLGASTTANVLLQQRNLAIGGKHPDCGQCRLCQRPRRPVPDAGHDAAALRHQPGRSRVSGNVKTAPVVPGVQPAKHGPRSPPTAPPARS